MNPYGCSAEASMIITIGHDSIAKNERALMAVKTKSRKENKMAEKKFNETIEVENFAESEEKKGLLSRIPKKVICGVVCGVAAVAGAAVFMIKRFGSESLSYEYEEIAHDDVEEPVTEEETE